MTTSYYAPSTMQKFICRLERLNAFIQSESSGDEVFLKHNGRKIWPVDQKFESNKPGGSTLNIAVNIELDNWVEIELWEYNYVLANKHIGTFKLFADRKGGPYVADLVVKNMTARYSLMWSVEGKLFKAPVII